MKKIYKIIGIILIITLLFTSVSVQAEETGIQNAEDQSLSEEPKEDSLTTEQKKTETVENAKETNDEPLNKSEK